MAFRITTAGKSIAVTSGLIAAYTAYRYQRPSQANSPTSSASSSLSAPLPANFTERQVEPSKARLTTSAMTVNHSFQTLFAVPLSCEGCVKAVSDSLHELGGITKVEGNVKDQLISVEGSAAPSRIVEAIQATGRDAILRGSGASNSAAVSILETFVDKRRTENEGTPREVRGLARMVEIGSSRTLVDLTVRGVSPGTYRATIRQYGDLKDGAESTGPVWSDSSSEGHPKGDLGTVQVDETGRGAAFVDRPFLIWETIGHAMVLTRQGEEKGTLQNDENTVVGVIARSAGVWDNDKTVCSCTGKTLWEERKEEVSKGML